MSVLAPSLDIFWRILDIYGHDPGPVFRRVGIDPASIRDPYARVPYGKIVALFRESIGLSGDPCMWLRVEDFWHPSHLGPMGYAWLASSTLRTALNRLQRFQRLLTSAANLSIVEDTQELRVNFDFRVPEAAEFGRDGGTCMLLVKMCRANAGPSFNPLGVTLAQPEPPADCRGQFFARFRCPVSFDQPRTSVTLAIPPLYRTLPGANAELAMLSDQATIRYLAHLNADDIRSRVMAEILRQLPSGGVTDASVAQALNMTPRTLQRQLKNGGTAFKRLLQEVRTELAEKYIRDSRLTLTEISFLLGFSEVSAFSRAYKRWTGAPPSRVRLANFRIGKERAAT